jgi:hypothetical protein
VGVYFGFLNRVYVDPFCIVISNTIVGFIAISHGFVMFWTIRGETEDEVVIQAKHKRNIDYVKITGVPVIHPESRVCNICQVQVSPLTKHCKSCNKCVAGYDHHCAFLSTCIGKRNYKQFLFIITVGSLMALYFATIAAYIVIIFVVDRPFFTVNSIYSLTISFTPFCLKSYNRCLVPFWIGNFFGDLPNNWRGFG